MADEFEIGDIIMCPRESIGIQESPIADDEYFIEESIPTAKIEESPNG